MPPLESRFLRWVVLDAVGTTIYPAPGVEEAYARAAAAQGLAFSAAEVQVRFKNALAAQSAIDRAAAYRTSEERERSRWRAIVTDVFGDAVKADAAFDDLWRHFASPHAWRCYADVGHACARLRRRGFRLAMASNFDVRLRQLVAGLPELRDVELLVISSEVGWLKPAPQFFAALLEKLNARPAEVLYIGDDVRNDFEAARTAGLPALLLDRRLGACESPATAGPLHQIAEQLSRNG